MRMNKLDTNGLLNLMVCPSTAAMPVLVGQPCRGGSSTDPYLSTNKQAIEIGKEDLVVLGVFGMLHCIVRSYIHTQHAAACYT